MKNGTKVNLKAMALRIKREWLRVHAAQNLAAGQRSKILMALDAVLAAISPRET